MNTLRALNTIVLILLPFLLLSQQHPDSARVRFSIAGYVKDMPSLSFGASFDSLKTLNLFHNRIRMKLELPGNFSFKMELRNRFFSGSQIADGKSFAQMLQKDNGLLDMSFVPASGDNFAWHINIDRLYANWNNDKWDVSIGRQRINWGIHTIWNPNDIFNAYNYLDFDYEERPGSDAIRIQYEGKNLDGFEAAFAFGKNRDEDVGALMYKFNAREYDFQFLGGIMKKDAVLGAGFAGNAGNAGLKGEATWFHPIRSGADSSDAVSFTLGIDYTNKHNWYFNGSYLLLTSGSNNADVKALQLLTAATAKNLMPFRHTFFLLANRTVNPLLTAGISMMYAPGGKNYLIFFPTLNYSVSANTEISLFLQSFLGNDNGYKTLGTAFYTRFKWSF